MCRQLHVWILSPYHSGSHQAWAQGYQRHSRHRVQLLTMAGRFWKWRMQGGAVELAAQAQARLDQQERPDLIVATDMVNLPAWLALMRRSLPASVPVLLYMHENQLTYPWRPGEKPDLTYGMINWLSQLCADRLLFNSRYHLESWFDALPRLLKHFPDHQHLARIAEVADRAQVLPVGIECAAFERRRKTARPDQPPLILWNQRWEYDKRPDRFFALLYRLQEAGLPFRLAVAGENFRTAPEEFAAAYSRLRGQIVQWGFVESRAEYARLLQQADLVISTAEHEFFGISVLEAICADAFPLLPHRLSYPELIPPTLHPACLYLDDDPDGEFLYQMARRRLEQPRPAPPSLQEYVRAHFDWGVVAARYDDLLETLV